MRKRGFTLIELLAVIVILAVIALIAVPIILNIISGAKKSSYQRTAEIYTDNLQNLIITANLHGSFNPSWCEYNNETEKTVCEYYDDEKEEYVYEKFDVLTNKTMPKEITMYLYDGFVEEGSYMIFDDDVKVSYIDNKWEIIEPIPHSKPIDATVVYYDVKNGALCSEDEYKKSYSSKYDDYLNSATDYNGIDISDAAITKTLVEGTGTEITPTIENDNSNPWISFNGGYKSDIAGVDCSTLYDEDSEEYEACGGVETTFKYKFTLTQEGALSFDWSVSSEKYGDELYYRIYLMNDTTETQTEISSDYISGTDMFEDESSISYKNVLETLNPGSYMVEFTYSKDSSVNNGYDAGYIKNIKVIEKPQINTTINQNSCLKFYEIGNTDTTRDLILDHNTTAYVEWIYKDYDDTATENSYCKNIYGKCTDQGPITALKQLKEDTKDWVGTNTPINIKVNQSGEAYKVYYETGNAYSESMGYYKVSYTIDYNGYKARLITANEVAKATGNIWFDSTKESFENGFSITHFDENKNGWLNDRLNDCEDYGCSNNAIKGFRYTSGYWTSTSVKGTINNAWSIRENDLEAYESYDDSGIRPVITINK